MRRKLNLRLVGILVVAAVASGIGVHFLHGYQVRRTADFLLQEATLAKEAGKPEDSINFVGRYVQLVPGDVKARLRMGIEQSERGFQLYEVGVEEKSPQLMARGIQLMKTAYLTLGNALRGDLSQADEEALTEAQRQAYAQRRVDAERQLAKLSPKLRRFREGRDHVKGLLATNSEDSELLRVQAECEYGLEQYLTACELYKRSHECSPEYLQSYVDLAGLLLERADELKNETVFLQTIVNTEKPYEGAKTPAEGAKFTVNRMVKNNPESSQAYFERAKFGLHFASLPAARVAGPKDSNAPTSNPAANELELVIKDVQKSLKLAPENRLTLLLASVVYQQAGQMDQARKYAEQCRASDPKKPEAYLRLADIEVADKRTDEAKKALEKGIVQIPDNVALRLSLASLALDLHKPDDAQIQVDWFGTANSAVTGSALPYLEFLKARILFENKQWRKASDAFSTLGGKLTAFPDLAKQADFLIGSCQKALGNADEQLIAFRKAASADPNFIQARVAVAETLVELKRVDEAVQEARSLSALPNSTQSAPLAIARLLITSNLNRAAAEIDWGPVEKAIEAADRAFPGSPEVVVLRAEVLVAKGKTSEAEKLLSDESAKVPDQFSLWTARIALAQRNAEWDRSRELLESTKTKFGDRLQFRLAKARQSIHDDGKKAGAELSRLALVPKGYSDAEQSQLATGIAMAALTNKDFSLAEELCKGVAKREPSNLTIRLLLFDLAFRSQRIDVMQLILDEVKAIEGGRALWQYGEAVRLAVLGQQQKQGSAEARKLFKESLELLAAVEMERPEWSQVPRLAAAIHELLGDKNAAVENYLKAEKLGDRSAEVTQRTFLLLSELHRDTEAVEFLKRLQEQPGEFNLDIKRAAAQVSFGLNDFDGAMEHAQLAAKDSKDYRDYLFLGRLQGHLGKDQEAEQSLRKAIELDASAPGAWIGLIQFLASKQRTDDAVKEIAFAKEKIKPEVVVRATAYCYQLLGNFDEADRNYDAALKQSPDDPLLIQQAAEFYLKAGRAAEAEKYLHRLTSGKLEVDAMTLSRGRRSLALLLTIHGDNPRFESARSLLDANLQADSKSTVDRRAKAIVLSTQSDRTVLRREAIRLLKGMIDQKEFLPEDRRLLARLYVADGKPSEARSQLSSLVSEVPEQPQFVADYVQLLLANGEPSEAALWIDKLVTLAPSARTTHELQAAVQFGLGKYKEVLKLLVELSQGGNPDNVAERRLFAGQQLEGYALKLRSKNDTELYAQFIEEADLLYREYLKEKPEEQLLLIGFLTRQEKLDEAISQLEEHWTKSKPEQIAAAAVAIQQNSLSSPAHQERLAAILKQAIATKDGEQIRTVIADLAMWRGDYPEAIENYREVIKENPNDASSASKKLSPNDVAATNNLAILLSVVQKQHGEAESLINELIQRVGLNAVLLDSRAMIWLAAEKPQRAIEDLNQAIEDAPSRDNLFHLAEALLRLGKEQEARRAFLRAINEKKLAEEHLQPFERAEFRRLKAMWK